MPIYVLKCPKCKVVFDYYKLRENSVPVCPKCGETDEFEKQITAPAIQFKGDGWNSTGNVSSVDPTTVEGVKRIDNPTPREKTLYKRRKEITGRKKKMKLGKPQNWDK